MKTIRVCRTRPLRRARRHTPLALPVALTAIALGIPAPADAQDIGAEVDALFRWATPETPGCAVAVSHDDERVVDRAGLCRSSSSRPRSSSWWRTGSSTSTTTFAIISPSWPTTATPSPWTTS